MKISKLLPVVLVGATLLISGCSSKKVQVENSTFLKQNEKCIVTNELKGTKTYVDKTVDFTKYENIYIKPVEVIASIDEEDMTDEQKQLVKQVYQYIT